MATRHRIALAITIGLATAGCVHGPVTASAREVFAVDVTLSTAPRLDDVRSDVHASIERAVGAHGGIGGALETVAFGGGPGDTRSRVTDAACKRSARACADDRDVARRTEVAMTALDGLVADGDRVGGSDPIGYLYRALGDLGTAGVPVHLTVWTDFASRSDTLDLSAPVDLSDADSRRRVIAALAVRGIDFASLQLTSDVVVDLRLVPTDVSSASTVYGLQIERLARELLRPSGALVTVRWLTVTSPT